VSSFWLSVFAVKSAYGIETKIKINFFLTRLIAVACGNPHEESEKKRHQACGNPHEVRFMVSKKKLISGGKSIPANRNQANNQR